MDLTAEVFVGATNPPRRRIFTSAVLDCTTLMYTHTGTFHDDSLTYYYLWGSPLNRLLCWVDATGGCELTVLTVYCVGLMKQEGESLPSMLEVRAATSGVEVFSIPLAALHRVPRVRPPACFNYVTPHAAVPGVCNKIVSIILISIT